MATLFHPLSKICYGFLITLFMLLITQCAQAQDGAPSTPNVVINLQSAYILTPAASSDGLLHGVDTGVYSSGFSDPSITALIEATLYVDGHAVAHAEVGVGVVHIDLSYNTALLSSGTHTVEWKAWGTGFKNGSYLTRPGDQTLWDLTTYITKP